MNLVSFDGGQYGEYNGVGFTEISIILLTQNEFFFGTKKIEHVSIAQMGK